MFVKTSHGQYFFRSMEDYSLDKDSSTDCVQACIKTLNTKQSTIIEMWKRLDSAIREGQRAEGEWAEVVRRAGEAMAEGEPQLFPLLKAAGQPAEIVLAQLEDQAADRASKAMLLLDKLDNSSKSVEILSPRLQGATAEESKQLATKLKLKSSELKVR